MPRHGRSSRHQWVSFIAAWLGAIAFTVALAAVEAARIAGTHATVARGWGVAIVAGAGTGLALTTFFGVLALVQRRRQQPRRGRWPLLLLAAAITLIGLVAVFTTTPPRKFGTDRAPFLVTSAIGVAEMAYVCACLAQLSLLLAALLVVALVRKRRDHVHAAADELERRHS